MQCARDLHLASNAQCQEDANADATGQRLEIVNQVDGAT